MTHDFETTLSRTDGVDRHGKRTLYRGDRRPKRTPSYGWSIVLPGQAGAGFGMLVVETIAKIRRAYFQHKKPIKQILAPFETQGPPSRQQAPRPRPKPVETKPWVGARSSSRRRPQSPLKVVRKARLRDTVWIVVAIGAAIAVVSGLFEAGGPTGSKRAGSGAVITGNTIQGRVTHVRDGDTIEVAAVPIRFQKLDCAESGTAAGERATRAMRALVAGEELTCQLEGRKSYDREIGTCALSDGRDIGRYMIAQGYCGRYR